jgi:hypothetical protein
MDRLAPGSHGEAAKSIKHQDLSHQVGVTGRATTTSARSTAVMGMNQQHGAEGGGGGTAGGDGFILFVLT